MKKLKLRTYVCCVLVLALLLSGGAATANGESDGSEGFVLLSEAVPDVILEVRYYSTYNFVGERVDGYEQPVVLLTKEAAEALKAVSDDVMAAALYGKTTALHILAKQIAKKPGAEDGKSGHPALVHPVPAQQLGCCAHIYRENVRYRPRQAAAKH